MHSITFSTYDTSITSFVLNAEIKIVISEGNMGEFGPFQNEFGITEYNSYCKKSVVTSLTDYPVLLTQSKNRSMNCTPKRTQYYMRSN